MRRLRIEILAAVLAAGAMHGLLFAGLRPSGISAATPLATAPLMVRMLVAVPLANGEPPAEPAVAFESDQASAIAPAIGTPETVDRADRTTPATTQDLPGRPEPTQAAETRDRLENSRLVARSPAVPQPPVGPAVEASPAAPDYLLGINLDPGPKPLGDIDPVFPVEAGLQEGMVVLRVFINEAGTVDEVRVLRSSPEGLFERSAEVAFQNARFSPGMLLGRPVKSQISVQVDFTPFNRGATVSGRGY